MPPARYGYFLLLAGACLLVVGVLWQQLQVLDKRERLLAYAEDLEAVDRLRAQLETLRKEQARAAREPAEDLNIEELRQQKQDYLKRLELRRMLIAKTPPRDLKDLAGVYQLKELDHPPKVARTVPPRYPLGMRMEGGTGEVVVKFVVGADGRVLDAIEAPPKNPDIELADPDLVDAAIVAVKQWQFQPALKDGRAVKSLMMVPIVFKISDAPAKK